MCQLSLGRIYILPWKYLNWLQVNILVFSHPFSKGVKSFYSKQGMPFLHCLTIAYFKNTSVGHIMESLSETFHPIKTIVYLIQIIQTGFEIPCDLMAHNPFIVPLCLIQIIINIMHPNNISNVNYIVCYRKTQIRSDLDCTNQILDLL